jgi:hypothetical protein
MGDRCWVDVTLRREDADKFLDAVMHAPDGRDEDGPTVTLSFPEANYGMGQPLEVAAAAKIEFYGSHTRGDSYGPNEFYSKGDGQVHYLPTDGDGDGYVITGRTSSERFASLRILDERILDRDVLVRRLHNPIYDLLTEASNG